MHCPILNISPVEIVPPVSELDKRVAGWQVSRRGFYPKAEKLLDDLITAYEKQKAELAEWGKVFVELVLLVNRGKASDARRAARNRELDKIASRHRKGELTTCTALAEIRRVFDVFRREREILKKEDEA